MWTTRSLKDRTRLVISFQCFWFFFLGGLNLVTVGSSFYMELAIDKKIVQILSCTYGVRFDWVFWTWHTIILNLVWMWVNSYIHPTQKCINKTVSFYIKHKCDCKSKKNYRVKWLIVLPFFFGVFTCVIIIRLGFLHCEWTWFWFVCISYLCDFVRFDIVGRH